MTAMRFNEGKTHFEYIPARVLYLATMPFNKTCTQRNARRCLHLFSRFEDERDPTALAEILDYCDWHDICEVLHFGAEKYDPWNWAKGYAWSIPCGSLKRHLMAMILEDEVIDEESKLSHLAHVGCNVVILLDFLKRHPDLDDLAPIFFAYEGEPKLRLIGDEEEWIWCDDLGNPVDPADLKIGGSL